MTKAPIIAALVAGLGFGSAAFAADKSAEQKAASPSAREAGIENPKAAAERCPESYDSVRKEHVERTKEQGAAGPSGDPIAPKLRDWSKIDKNDDGLIQPAEMDAWNEKYTGRQVPK